MDINSINERLNNLKQQKKQLTQEIKHNKILLKNEKTKIDLIETGASIEDVLSDKNLNIAFNHKKLAFMQHSKVKVIEDKNYKEMSEEEKKLYLNQLEQYSDKNFINKVQSSLDQIPESNGSRFFNKMNINIGIIADEFLYNSFNGVANFHYITRENYKEYSGKLDLFLVVSAWKGLNMEWKGLGNPNIRKHRDDLFKIIEFYRAESKPIVFYSKEDPVNYDIFVEIAKKCDYIFTTAEEKVADYKRDCKNDRVGVLNFGVNPLYHNPVGVKNSPKLKEVMFSGSWYSKYPKRMKETRVMFNGILDSGKELKIIDRNYGLKLSRHFFPLEYVKYISPAVSHETLQRLHKVYDWAINFNSVTSSETMFANRIYELQALGNVLLSNYSVGVNNKFPNVFIIHEQDEVKRIIDAFSDEEVFKHQVFGIRRVMSKETTFNRIEEILNFTEQPYEKIIRTICVVTPTINDVNVNKMFNYQTYPYKEMVNAEDFNEEIKAKFDMIAFFDPNKEYGEFYLEDMINAFKYTDSDYITKDCYYSKGQIIPGVEFDFVKTMKDKTKTVFWSDSFTAQELLNFQGPIKLDKGFSIDRFEVNENPAHQIVNHKQYRASVIIPVYNNGDHLMHKCFNSLKRSSIFNELEIILVDDGSTDQYTTKMVNRLGREYSNVKTYLFNDNGSGSASRPRNKGIEIATSKYITYLDPDNEAINDGFAQLLHEIELGDYDMVVGNMLKIDTEPSHFNYYKTVMQFNHSDVIEGNKKGYLANSSFKAMSIQALMVKKEVIEHNSLIMPEGAAGQDTVFFHELLLNSNKVKAINTDIHVYYAAVSGSTVNSVTKKFFEKYYLLETYRSEFLTRNNLLDQYLTIRFEYYFKNWYLQKLKKSSNSELEESITILGKILDLYDSNTNFEDIEIKHFYSLYKNNDIESIIKNYV
ncbi:glycosyltransferase [Fictibacillus sp. JL2B1089]|uniref:glycosyltransferase n=1 Tax=Fictibacillus sp. JL2B1089 TaxID=3399565 RepID=UPI003A893AEF